MIDKTISLTVLLPRAHRDIADKADITEKGHGDTGWSGNIESESHRTKLTFLEQGFFSGVLDPWAFHYLSIC